MNLVSYWKDTPIYRSWNQSIQAWIDPSSSEYLSPDQRVAIFDLDGTIWCEKPYFVEILFVIEQLKSALKEGLDDNIHLQVADTIRLAEIQISGSGAALIKAFNLVYPKCSNARLERMSGEWLDTAQHQDFPCSYLDLAYLPMKEWIDTLHAHQFSCYVCTGSSEQFVRPWIEAVFGICADKVLGSELYGKGEAHPLTLNINQEKVYSVESRCLEIPVLVVGNSEGDSALFEWVLDKNPAAQCYVLDHDDPDREYQYPLSESIERWLEQDKSKLRRISMKNDWERVFAQWYPKD